MPKSSGINLPRDVFLHLLAIITLVVSAVSFGVLLFEYINVYVPDIVSDPYFSRSSHYSSMRSALATLIIIFAVFLWVTIFIKKDIFKYPEKKELKIRKWLLYLTLFVSALIIIGDLVALMRSFLEGELSQRFILKILAILFIAGSVFIHYLSELRENKFKWIKLFDWTVILAVLGGIVSGFFVAGTPQNQRLIRLDERRISDMQNIQWQIINYWQRKETLPSGLDDLSDPLSGFAVPLDPETGGYYDYRIIGALTFELCAIFSAPSLEEGSYTDKSPVSAYPMAYQEALYIWQHGQGRACFERTIDPDLYPSLKDGIKPRPL